MIVMFKTHCAQWVKIFRGKIKTKLGSNAIVQVVRTSKQIKLKLGENNGFSGELYRDFANRQQRQGPSVTFYGTLNI
jgi:hypothetical protein